MKMTMHIDEALLAEVMKATGAKSKTEAVDMALRKVAHKFRQREGLGMTPAEIAAAYDADFAEAMLIAEKPTPCRARKSAR